MKIIKIKSCASCPYLEIITSAPRAEGRCTACAPFKSMEQGTMPSDIQEFCPLEDYEEKKED